MPALLATILVACSGRYAPDFTLRDDGGSTWMLSQQRGKAVLITFGFTRCADTCPATVAKLAALGRIVPDGGREIEVAFVTVDPAHDTVAALHRFVARFGERGNAKVVGLTGTPQQLSQIQSEYKVWSAPTAHGMAHSAVIFLVDPQGRMRGVRDDDDSENSLARAVRTMIAAS
jgi:protein SCO1